MTADHLNAETVGALIDGELDPTTESAARRHLAACHVCALEVLTATQLKSATSRAAKRFIPSPAAVDRLRMSIQPPSPKKRAQIMPFRSVLWATAAALLVFAILVAGDRLFQQSGELTAELVDQHLVTLPNSSIPQVVSTDRHTVKPWFQGKLPFSFNLPEPNALPPETALEGANLTYFNGKATAMLLFSIRKHRVTVFVTQENNALDPQHHTARAGFNLSAGKASGLEFVAVSDANSADLDSLVSVLLSVQ